MRAWHWRGVALVIAAVILRLGIGAPEARAFGVDLEPDGEYEVPIFNLSGEVIRIIRIPR